MKLFKRGTALTLAMLLMAVCLTACGGSGGQNTPAQGSGGTASPDPAADKTEIATTTYTAQDEEEGAVLTLEVPEIEGITVSEISSRAGYRIEYPDGGWQLDIWIGALNSEALAKAISEESVTYGSNTGSLEFSSWAAQGKFDFGPVPDKAYSLTAEYDLRPADTYQPDDEAELRGYLEDEYVGMIFSGMKVELSK